MSDPADFEQLADEAEHGYEVDPAKGLHGDDAQREVRRATGRIAPARQGLDWLLERHRETVPSRYERDGVADIVSPWVLVDFGTARYAIWKTTGAVFELDGNGAVGDDALFEPPRTGIDVGRTDG